MMTVILLVLLVLLSVTLSVLITSHRHQRKSSEIIRRLDEHHQMAVTNVDLMKHHTNAIEKEVKEIRDFFDGLKSTPEHKKDTEISDFVKTGKFTL